jgi:hypothetical protein
VEEEVDWLPQVSLPLVRLDRVMGADFARVVAGMRAMGHQRKREEEKGREVEEARKHVNDLRARASASRARHRLRLQREVQDRQRLGYEARLATEEEMLVLAQEEEAALARRVAAVKQDERERRARAKSLWNPFFRELVRLQHEGEGPQRHSEGDEDDGEEEGGGERGEGGGEGGGKEGDEVNAMHLMHMASPHRVDRAHTTKMVRFRPQTVSSETIPSTPVARAPPPAIGVRENQLPPLSSSSTAAATAAASARAGAEGKPGVGTSHRRGMMRTAGAGEDAVAAVLRSMGPVVDSHLSAWSVSTLDAVGDA